MKQFLRNFSKQKTVGILNICGLSLGIMVSLTVGLWAINELTFDNFHTNGDKMYRVVQSFVLNNEPIKAATSFKPLGELAVAEIPEIEQMCRVVVRADGVTINNIVNFGVKVLITDPNFFSFFSFPLKTGDVNTAFSAPDNVILTETAVKKYYPHEDPIGKTIYIHGSRFTVSAVMYDIPLNSHIQGEMVFPLFGEFKDLGWDSSFSYDTYFIIPPNSDFGAIEKKLIEINKQGSFSFLKDAFYEVKLEPLKEVHFSKANSGFDSAVKGDKQLLGIFLTTALAILIIACINFTNLFISTSFIRAKTIGIKKSQGATKTSLILDFYKETIMYVLVSVVGGVLLAVLILPVFNNYTGSQIKIDFLSFDLYLYIFCLIVITTLLAGSFPALQMTRFGIIETLTSKFRGKKMSGFQKVLIIIQFTSSICLLIVVFFFGRQIDHILSQDLRFDNKNIIYLQGWGDFGSDYKSLRDELIQDPSIGDVVIRQYNLPFKMGNGIGGKNFETGEEILLDLSEVTPNYFDFFGMKFVSGENPLSLESTSSANYCVINERAAEVLGLKDPVGKSFTLVSIGGKLSENDGEPYIVKGVIRDTYVKSLHQEPDPQMYLNASHTANNPIFFKIAGDPQKAIKTIEKKWKEMVPNVPFEYHFLDETYQKLYLSEMNTRNVLSYALIITFIITITGLYAMAFYSTQRRIKEIGIRKINGATLLDLLLLLNKDIVIWVIISFVIACPISYLFLNNWLDGFVIKVNLSIWVFLLAGIVSCLVALLTVSYQTWKAARANPVDSVKNE
ncbi:FtsX-like permease family protein [Dysgonomonas sp. HDW5B]|uniref:ABC transporter permease n=1 Tax=Dysgonomonas sp. HDW5B TaxID=2714927 RepID=UPI001407914A|nr:ABC transporter permease [Dysgonomonas sp. HDW5B]QIK54411.1 FtsX-like permease family protein [Dysgonomonas sp. HDW5B]